MEEQLSQEIIETIERWEQAMAELQPVWEAVRDAMIELWRRLVKVVKEIIVFIRRWLLYIKLVRLRFPSRLAKFIAWRWPERWLPALQFA